MSKIFLSLLGTLIGPLSGLITTRVMDFIDDVMGITAKWPDTIKQLLVMALAAIVPVVNAQWGLHLPPDVPTFFASTDVQYIVGLVLALILKGHSTTSSAAALTAAVAQNQIAVATATVVKG